MDKVIQAVGVIMASIAIVTIIIKGFGLMKSSGVERILTTDYRRLLIFVSEYLYFAVVLGSLISVVIMILQNNKSWAMFLALELLVFSIITFIFFITYQVFTHIRYPRTFYYIVYEGIEYYIIKSTSDSEILLCSKPILNNIRSVDVLIRNRAILYETKILNRKIKPWSSN